MTSFGKWCIGKGADADRVKTTGESGPQRTVAELWYEGWPPEERRTHGLLIAAAPDLLAACEAGLLYLEDVAKGLQKDGWDSDAKWLREHQIAMMQAAIAKAQGED